MNKLDAANLETGGSILIDQIVGLGYCIGCGACAAVDHSPVRIVMDAFGCYQAVLQTPLAPDDEERMLAVCPFSDAGLNEDELGQHWFEPHATYDSHLGYTLATFAGHVTEGEFRERGSSGGLGKWILAELLAQNLVDAVIQVKALSPETSGGMLYGYQVDHTVDQVRAGAKSAYYPVEMSGVLQFVKENPGRYAIVGIPCFIKAIRRLMLAEPVFASRIAYCVGLICGHLKSTHYAAMLGWQMGIAPGTLAAIDFRRKLPGAQANQRGVEITGSGSAHWLGRSSSLFGSDYNLGFLQYEACDYCDDVVAETADITIGDAWLPEYIVDGAGTNIVVVRHPDLLAILQSAAASGKLALETVPSEKAIRSQAGGFRQRREGLAYRLHLREQAGTWHPAKRVAAGDTHLARHRKQVYQTRMLLARESRRLFQAALAAGSYAVFDRPMRAIVARFQRKDWRRFLINTYMQSMNRFAALFAPLRRWLRNSRRK